MLKIKCKKSSKGNEYYVLVYEKDGNDIYLSFDVQTLARVAGVPVSFIYRNIPLGDEYPIQ